MPEPTEPECPACGHVMRLHAHLSGCCVADCDCRPESCAHPNNESDVFTNEQLCLDCGELRDLMAWEEWEVVTKDMPDPFTI